MTIENTQCLRGLANGKVEKLHFLPPWLWFTRENLSAFGVKKHTIIYRALVFFSLLALSGKWTLPWLLLLFDVLAQGLAIPNSLRLYSSFVESEEWSLGKRETVSKTGWKLWLCLCLYGGQTQPGEKLFSWAFLTDSHDKKYRQCNCPNGCLRHSKGKFI